MIDNPGSIFKGRLRSANAIAFAIALSASGQFIGAPAHAAVYKSLHDFWSHPSGASPIGGLVRAADGTMYGVTYRGADYGFGGIFSLGVNGVLTNIYSFRGGSDPGAPFTGLSAGPDGCLYGASTIGGGYSHGTIFRFNPATATITVLHTFKDETPGGWAAPVAAADGSVYVTNAFHGIPSNLTYRWTAAGGLKKILDYSIEMCAGGDGFVYGCSPNMVFRFNSDGSIHKLRDLSDAEGTGNTYSLAIGPGGILWGLSLSGGPNNAGVEYKIGTNGQGFYILHTNAPADSVYPIGPISVGPDNRMYSFAYDFDGPGTHCLSMGVDGKYKILFDNMPGGSTDKITFGRDSHPYFEQTNSAARDGAIYTITKAGSVATFRAFEVSDLVSPITVPLRLGNGDVIGIAASGGAFRKGGIYRLTAGGKFTILTNFVKSFQQADSKLTLGADGNFYALAEGQFCKVTPDGTVVTTDIQPADASAAIADHGLTLGSDGLLYAVGNYAAYTVNYAGVATKVASIPSYGYLDKLTLAADGNLYASMPADGAGNLNIYRITPAGIVTTTTYSLGADPYTSPSQLTTAPDGSLYGIAFGTVEPSFIFKIDVVAGTAAKIYTFPANSALVPQRSEVVVRADGTVFGSAYRKAANNLSAQGVVFAVSPAGDFSIAANVPKHSGPRFGIAGSMQMDGDHAIVGVSSGGLHGDGALFRITGL